MVLSTRVLALLLPFLWLQCATSAFQYLLPENDTTPILDYLVLDPNLAYYTTQSLITALPRGYLLRPVGGAFGSCTYTTNAGNTLSDTCLSYIRGSTATGCTYLGEPCQISWVCKSVQSLSTAYFCGCNQNDPVPCPNGAVCVSLAVEVPGEVFPSTDQDVPLYDAGTPLHAIDRAPSYCQCLAGWRHWTIAGPVPYGATDPRVSTPISLQATVGFFDPLVTGDETIIAPCTRRIDSLCNNGIPSYLYIQNPNDYTLDFTRFAPCYINVRGTPGCGLDVLPCICNEGYVGAGCSTSFSSDRCGYSDLATPPPLGVFSVAFLCMGRGTCAGDTSYNLGYQDPKFPAYDLLLIRCTSCNDPYWGSTCQVTCGYTNANATTQPNCPADSSCQNFGTHFSPDPKCVCDAGYVDPYTSELAGPPSVVNCFTCTNEIGTHVPACNSVGTCPIATYKCSILGCPASHIPSVPLKCVCPSYYVDSECAVPNNITYTCGAQNIAVVCEYRRTIGSTDFRYDCTIDTTLNTGTTPNEQYPLSTVCHDVSLTDTGVLSGSSLLRLWQGDDGCAAVRTQCAEEYDVDDICPIPFRDFDVVVGRPANAFCDPPDVRQYLKAIYGPTELQVTVFGWMVRESPDHFSFQTPPAPLYTGDLLISNCVLAIAWKSFITRPDALYYVIQEICNPQS